jgi:glyoxylase-like metal-dependent hydrolase (beta-lactamase superfamily II)
MKRFLKIALLLIVVFVLVLAALIAPAFIGNRAVMDGYEVNGVRVVADGFTTIGVIPIDDRQVVLVDTGNDASGEAIMAELSRRRLDAQAVSTIFLTHGHNDHIAAARLFPRAAVLALGAEVPLVEGREASRGPLPRWFRVNDTGITVARPLTDGEVVTVGGVPIRVYAVPGHTGGSAAYFARGVLFLGDSANVTSENALVGAPWVFSDSQAENRASLVRLEQKLIADGVTVDAIIPAHSGASQGMSALTAFATANTTQ